MRLTHIIAFFIYLSGSAINILYLALTS